MKSSVETRGLRAGRRAWGLWGAALLAVLVAACGGGTGPIEPFRPSRMMVMGDELSTVLPDGRKYGVNAVSAETGALDCQSNPMWTQTVAGVFGLGFEQCKPTGMTEFKAQMYAQPGARSAAVVNQIDQAQAAGAFEDRHLVTVFFGLHDLLELYAQYPAKSQAELRAEARARGVALGQQVNRVARSGPAVLLVTAPDLGLTPFGAAQTAAFPEPQDQPTRARFLSDLTDAFNSGLRVTIINDGRLIGLVSADQMVRDIQGVFGSFFGFSNLVTPMCQSAVMQPNCTTATLVEGAAVGSWGFATDVLYGPALQSRLGQIAASRAVRNPF